MRVSSRSAVLAAGLVLSLPFVTAGAAPLVLASATMPHGQLHAVTATSPRNAWAVGTLGGKHTLVEHWNGSSWRVQASPNESTYNYLYGVSATAASNAWAVGYSQNSVGCGSCSRTLIEHWNGSS